MYYADCHIHSNYSHDIPASRPVSVFDICESAIAKGLSYVAITDHYEPDLIDAGKWQPYPFADIHQTIEAARAQYKNQFYLAYGIEYGEPFYDTARAASTLSTYPYDIVLGSMHRLPGHGGYAKRDFRAMTAEDRTRVLENYLEGYTKLVHCDAIDVFTHPTYPLRYLLRAGIPFDIRCWEERMRPLLRTIAEKGSALEFNTSVMHCPNIGFPDHTMETVMRWYRMEGGELVTFASDAHTTADIGLYYKHAMKILREFGFRYITTYEKRIPIPHKINE